LSVARKINILIMLMLFFILNQFKDYKFDFRTDKLLNFANRMWSVAWKSGKKDNK
jgi:hypothetical protein